jgi:hypothetical protein
MELISLDGLKKLSKMPESERPSNWKPMIVHYLNHKKKFIKEMEEKGRDTYYLEMQFVEALRLAKSLSVVYGRLGD